MNSSNSGTTDTTWNCQYSLLYWITQTLFFPILIALYVIILVIIYKYKSSDFQNSYFILITGLGMADLISLTIFLYDFIWCFCDNTKLVTVDKITKFLYGGIGWYCSIYLNVFIALNRFVAIAFYSYYKRIWTRIRTKIIVTFCFISGLITNTIAVVLKKYAVVPEESLRIFDMTLSCGLAIVIVLTYIISVGTSIVRMKSFIGAKGKYIREVKMLIQGIYLAVMLIFADVTFWFPFSDTQMLEITLILSAGSNPIIYLALDARLRLRFGQLWQIRKKVSVVISTFTNQFNYDSSKTSAV